MAHIWTDPSYSECDQFLNRYCHGSTQTVRLLDESDVKRISVCTECCDYSNGFERWYLKTDGTVNVDYLITSNYHRSLKDFQLIFKRCPAVLQRINSNRNIQQRFLNHCTAKVCLSLLAQYLEWYVDGFKLNSASDVLWLHHSGGNVYEQLIGCKINKRLVSWHEKKRLVDEYDRIRHQRSTWVCEECVDLYPVRTVLFQYMDGSIQEFPNFDVLPIQPSNIWNIVNCPVPRIAESIVDNMINILQQDCNLSACINNAVSSDNHPRDASWISFGLLIYCITSFVLINTLLCFFDRS